MFEIENTTIDNFAGANLTITELQEKFDEHYYTLYGEDSDTCYNYYLSISGGSAIYLKSKDTISVISKNNYYRGGDLSVDGSIYHVSAFSDDGCSFIEENSQYMWNQALFGGAIYLDYCYDGVSFDRVNFTHNRARMGGVIQAILVDLSETNSEFSHNYAIKGAIFYAMDSELEISESTFKNNHCHDGCLVYSDDIMVQISI